MPLTFTNPAGLPTVPLYQQLVVASGTRLVFLAGQVAQDADGNLVGAGDLAAQVEQCYLNVATALAAVGATFDDVVKLTVYVVDFDPGDVEVFATGVARAASRLGLDSLSRPPLTGVGIVALAAPGMLVEVEATAGLD